MHAAGPLQRVRLMVKEGVVLASRFPEAKCLTRVDVHVQVDVLLTNFFFRRLDVDDRVNGHLADHAPVHWAFTNSLSLDTCHDGSYSHGNSQFAKHDDSQVLSHGD